MTVRFRSDTNRVTFIINGEPRGKGRPRFTKNGHAYTDEKTKAYESLVWQSYLDAADGYKFTSPVRVIIMAHFRPPKKSKKVVGDMLAGHILPTKKPDVDNVAKIILDGLNRIAWDDDTQVVDLSVSKYYSDEPRVAVMIEEINADRC